MIRTLPESKMNNQMILQEQFDENYEPTQEEIREYAVYIGIDPDRVNKNKTKRTNLFRIFFIGTKSSLVS
jgi:hypothetical protein